MSFSVFSSCKKEPVIDPNKLELFGKAGAWGLQTKEGEVVLDSTFLFLNFKTVFEPKEYYLKYTRHDGRKGIYYKTLDKPYFEVGPEISYFKMIDSMKYFSFAGKRTDDYGNKLEGVMDVDHNVILETEYGGILYYGGKHFYASYPKDKKYAAFDKNGEFVNNRGRYGWVSSKHGVTFASKGRDGAGDIWGAIGCLLNEDGIEITEHVYQSVSAFECLFDKTKIFVHMRKDGIMSLYYPNGERINKGEYVGVYPMTAMSGHSKKFIDRLKEKYGNRNIIGSLKKDGKSYYLTYSGDLLPQ